jgi:hypothetical protein
MKRLLSIAALIGGVIPLVLFFALTWLPFTDELPDTLILSLWPTYFFLGGLAGPLTWFTWTAVVASALVNAAIYAVVVFIVCKIVKQLGKPTSHSK